MSFTLGLVADPSKHLHGKQYSWASGSVFYLGMYICY